MFKRYHVGKQPVACSENIRYKENCANNREQELQENMVMCTGRREMTEIMLRPALKTIQSNINKRKHVLAWAPKGLWRKVQQKEKLIHTFM